MRGQPTHPFHSLADKAADGVINVALYHCLAPSIQTALFNAPLVVLVGWALGKPMDLNFEIFMIGLLVLSILVVGNFLRDGESNWLEGALLVVCDAVTACFIADCADCLHHHRHRMLVLPESRCGYVQRNRQCLDDCGYAGQAERAPART